MRIFLLMAAAVSIANAWWKPTPGMTWQIVLSHPLKAPYPDVQVFDFDLFDNPKSTVTAVHDKQAKAICYFSAGSWEKWRPDAGEFPKSAIGRPLAHWPGERWLDVRSPAVRKIMLQRMDLAVSKGCDAVDPDNIDCYDNGGGGFNLTAADAADYVLFLATEAHKRGLACGLKNGLEIIPKVLAHVDFAVNEQCLQYDECKRERPFLEAGKPVFEIEYRKGTPTKAEVDAICDNPTRKGYSTLIKHLSLDAWYIACPCNSAFISSSTPSLLHLSQKQTLTQISEQE